MVKDVKIYFIGLKKTCLGILDRGDRDKDIETGLEERGVLKMSTTVLPYTRCTLSSLLYITYVYCRSQTAFHFWCIWIFAFNITSSQYNCNHGPHAVIVVSLLTQLLTAQTVRRDNFIGDGFTFHVTHWIQYYLSNLCIVWHLLN